MVIMISSVATVMCAAGISQITSERRADKLWNPSETESQKLEAKYEINFPRDGAMSTFIAENKAGGNVLTPTCLADLYKLHTQIAAIQTPICDATSTDAAMKTMIEENQCTTETHNLNTLCEGKDFQCIMSNPLL